MKHVQAVLDAYIDAQYPSTMTLEIKTIIHEVEAALQLDRTVAVESLKATLTMCDRGDKPAKLDDALTWRANDEMARGMAIAAIQHFGGEG